MRIPGAMVSSCVSSPLVPLIRDDKRALIAQAAILADRSLGNRFVYDGTEYDRRATWEALIKSYARIVAPLLPDPRSTHEPLAVSVHELAQLPEHQITGSRRYAIPYAATIIAPYLDAYARFLFDRSVDSRSWFPHRRQSEHAHEIVMRPPRVSHRHLLEGETLRSALSGAIDLAHRRLHRDGIPCGPAVALPQITDRVNAWSVLTAREQLRESVHLAMFWAMRITESLEARMLHGMPGHFSDLVGVAVAQHTASLIDHALEPVFNTGTTAVEKLGGQRVRKIELVAQRVPRMANFDRLSIVVDPTLIRELMIQSRGDVGVDDNQQGSITVDGGGRSAEIRVPPWVANLELVNCPDVVGAELGSMRVVIMPEDVFLPIDITRSTSVKFFRCTPTVEVSAVSLSIEAGNDVSHMKILAIGGSQLDVTCPQTTITPWAAHGCSIRGIAKDVMPPVIRGSGLVDIASSRSLTRF